VSDDGHVVQHIWITIEKLMSPAPDENSGKQKNDHGNRECDAQCRNASLLNHRYHKGAVRLHAKRVAVLSNDIYDASVGFLDATEGGIATPSSGGNAHACVVVLPVGRTEEWD
jgi:hypothetical protein